MNTSKIFPDIEVKQTPLARKNWEKIEMSTVLRIADQSGVMHRTIQYKGFMMDCSNGHEAVKAMSHFMSGFVSDAYKMLNAGVAGPMRFENGNHAFIKDDDQDTEKQRIIKLLSQ